MVAIQASGQQRKMAILQNPANATNHERLHDNMILNWLQVYAIGTQRARLLQIGCPTIVLEPAASEPCGDLQQRAGRDIHLVHFQLRFMTCERPA
jgi:hypothetical protein